VGAVLRRLRFARVEGRRAPGRLGARFEAHDLPYASTTRPEALFDEPQLHETGRLAQVTLPADASARQIHTHAPPLPLTLAGQRLPLRSAPPALGSHSLELLRDLCYDEDGIAALCADGVVGAARA
jgi:crotonobetainyl-CoA:carnitine CoA-transferase CaiB-like acyl-CoA transferase